VVAAPQGIWVEAGLAYRSVAGAAVGDNGSPCPFNRTHEMISRRGPHAEGSRRSHDTLPGAVLSVDILSGDPP